MLPFERLILEDKGAEQQPDDNTLIEMIRDPQQRKRAFEWMVRLYKEQVYFHARRMVVDHADADDVTQNAFIKAWKALPNFRGDSKIGTWLYRIATNESLTLIEKRKRIAGIPLDDVAHKMESHLEVDEYYSGDAIQLKLQGALCTLPPKQKAVFLMRYYDEKPYQEISEITGTSVGALKASYHHAVQKIEAYLTR